MIKKSECSKRKFSIKQTKRVRAPGEQTKLFRQYTAIFKEHKTFLGTLLFFYHKEIFIKTEA